MDTVKKHRNLALVALLAGVLAIGMFAGLPPAIDEAHAQSEIGVDTSHQTFSTTFTNGAAAIDTSTGKRIVLHALVVRASSAGVLVLKDGSNSGTTLLNLYLAQDTVVQITPEMLGGSVRTTAGNCLFIGANSATITGWARYSRQL